MSEKTIEEYVAELRRGDDPDHVLRMAIAAAEERGFRRGVEEAIGVLEWMRQCERVASHIALLLGSIENIRVLAPRDSAPARYCDESHPSQPLRCGRFVCHDGPHTAFVPGYEHEQRAAVHWDAPRDSEGQAMSATPPDSGEREMLTSGQRADVSIATHRQRLRALFEENEARLLPDSALRSVLLDADRFADELVAVATGPLLPRPLAQRILAALEKPPVLGNRERIVRAALADELRKEMGKP